MQFEEVAERVRGIPYMNPEFGRRVYQHIRETRPEQALELGTAHGVSAAYIAAALEANDRGHLTTVDHGGASYDPWPQKVVNQAGLAHRVTIVRDHSSYDWFLKQQIERSSDASGNCAPIYDFVFLDGSHNFVVDGLAVVLVEKLLRPGGWLLLDDLDWTYEQNPWVAPELWPDGNARPFGPMSESERTEPHVRAVFELIVKQHPSFTTLVREDEWYGWAQKQPGEKRRYKVETSRSLSAIVTTEIRRRRRRSARPST
ncbi:MAG: class I SAM-dependent methyltransferase [Solirubrobacterales bacterium]